MRRVSRGSREGRRGKGEHVIQIGCHSFSLASPDSDSCLPPFRITHVEKASYEQKPDSLDDLIVLISYGMSFFIKLSYSRARPTCFSLIRKNFGTTRLCTYDRIISNTFA